MHEACFMHSAQILTNTFGDYQAFSFECSDCQQCWALLNPMLTPLVVNCEANAFNWSS